mgnify:CR=1 FL=1|jgi:hypothetical protein
MKISGNQTALREIFSLLDKNFKHPPFGCNCKLVNDSRVHTLICDFQDKWFEDNYGCSYYVYEIEYDGSKISKATLLHRDYANANILNGCIR